MQHRGPGDYLVAAPTFPLLELKLLPEFKRFFETLMRAGRYTGSPVRRFVLSEEGAMLLWGETPSTETHVFFGHAQDPDSLESATAKAAWLDEAGQAKFKRGSYDAIKRRLSIHRGRDLITTTPYYWGWLKTDLADEAGKPGSDIDLVRFESRMNPAFSQTEFDDARERLPAWRFDMFYRALFTRPAGLIYDALDEQRHVIPAFSPPADWRREWGFDFGGVNTACVKLALDPETNRHHLYAEYLAGGRTAKQHAEALLQRDTKPQRAAGGAPGEDNWRLEFTQAGLPIARPPISDVELGITRLYGLLRSDRLRIHDTCEAWLNEARTYSRALDENNQPLERIENKSTYHLLDATRYIAATIEHQVRPRRPHRTTATNHAS